MLKDGRTMGLSEASTCPSPTFRGDKNDSQLKQRKAKRARVHIFFCLRVTGPERALASHQISLLSIPQNREALKAMCSSLLLHIPPALRNSTQKDVMFLQRSATHPLPLSDKSFQDWYGDTEKGHKTH